MILTLLRTGIKFVSLLILYLQTKLNINSKNTSVEIKLES